MQAHQSYYSPQSSTERQTTEMEREEIKKLGDLILYATQYERQPIDLNYVAIPKDIWEDICRLGRLAEKHRG